MFSHKAISETPLFHSLLNDNAVGGLHGSNGPTNRSTGSARKGARLPVNSVLPPFTWHSVIPGSRPHGRVTGVGNVRFLSRPEEISMIGAVIEGPPTGVYCWRT